LKPHAAFDLLTATGKRLRESSRLLRHTASRNVNKEHGDNRTPVMRVADWISDFSGSLPFLFIHVGLFFLWIVLNVSPFVRSKFGGFDPFPFGLLTMAVSLEAIVLSVFVLLSQNRQVERERVRNDIEFDINLKAELQIHHMHEKVDQLREDLLERLMRLERQSGEDRRYSATTTGTTLFVVVPTPSWPEPLYPKHKTVLVPDTAHVWIFPGLMARMSLIPVTLTGLERFVVVPSPNCP